MYKIVSEETNKAGLETLPPLNPHNVDTIESILGSIKNKALSLDLNVSEVAVSYWVHFAKSQAYPNGNKRMSIFNTTVYLALNKLELDITLNLLKSITLVIIKDRRPISVVEHDVVNLVNKCIIDWHW